MSRQPPDPPAAELLGVTHRYGRRPVLYRVDLEARRGEVLGVVGPNGGGKSTLLLLLAGLVRPGDGRVRVAGVDAHRVARSRTGTIGLITARPGLYPLLTGWENLDFFGGLFGLDREAVRRRARTLVDRAGLAGHLDLRVGAYSTGMQQKLSLVRALLLDPALLLLDEPTANLDPVSARDMHRAMREQADRGVAVVLATHDLDAAEAICDRVAVLDGRVLHLESLAGPREVPPAGRLLRLYRDLAVPR